MTFLTLMLKILIWKVCYFLLFQVKFRKDENNKTFSSKQIKKSIKKALLWLQVVEFYEGGRRNSRYLKIYKSYDATAGA